MAANFDGPHGLFDIRINHDQVPLGVSICVVYRPRSFDDGRGLLYVRDDGGTDYIDAYLLAEKESEWEQAVQWIIALVAATHGVDVQEIELNYRSDK